YGKEITFLQWFIFAFPISLTLLLICWVYLTRFAFVFRQKEFPGGKMEIKKQLKALGKISPEEKTVLIVFICMALAWISRSFIIERFVPAIDDTIIAIFFSILLFLLPTSKKGEKMISWRDAVKLPWGITI